MKVRIPMDVEDYPGCHATHNGMRGEIENGLLVAMCPINVGVRVEVPLVVKGEEAGA